MFDPKNYHPETPEKVLNILKAADDCAVDEKWRDEIGDILNITGEFILARKIDGTDEDTISYMEDAHQGMSYCWNVEGDIDAYICELERVYSLVQDL